MFPSPSSADKSSAASASLPPLPDLSGGPKSSADSGGSNSFLASLVSGLAPVKQDITQIVTAARHLASLGIPGADQVCSQIIAAATALMSMAAQGVMQKGMGGMGGVASGPPSAGPGGPPMPPPPGGPQPIMGGGGSPAPQGQ